MLRVRLTLPLTLAAMLIGAGGLAVLAEPVGSQTPALNRAGLRLRPVGRFQVPTFISAIPGDSGRIAIVERAGTIRVIHDGVRLRRPFLDIHQLVDSGGERGLLSVAFAPNYQRSGLFYVYYTSHSGTLTIEEYRRSATDPDRANPASRRRVMGVPHPHHNHNSGQLQFGPDGYLYAGTGDGGASGDPNGNGQNLRTHLGKILRFDPRGTAPGQRSSPPDNPFRARPDVPPEIWAYGFRNPWRFSFDMLTGDLAIADVGQDEIEEIDFRRLGRTAGQNFGWDACEGTQAFPPSGSPRRPCALTGAVAPVLEHPHEGGYCSVIGGVVVRDRSLVGLYGRYIYGDLCRPELRSTVLSEARAQDDRPLGLDLPGVISVGQSSNGCVFVGLLDGRVYRVAPAARAAACPPGQPGPVADPPADRLAPSLLIDAPRTVRAGPRGSLALRVRCDEPCLIRATVTLSGGTGKPAVRSATPTRAAGGEERPVRISLRALGSAPQPHGLRGIVRVSATDAAGNAATTRSQIRVLR